MTVTTYPNGQVLTSDALSITDINVLVQTLTCGMLGINPPDPSAVRIDWPTEGQPSAALPSQNVCYLSCVLAQDPYTKVRDRASSSGLDRTVTQTWLFTRSWRVNWLLYGPDSTDRARQIYSALFQDYFNDQFATLGKLYPLLSPDEPTRAPENHNAQWYERADFSCMFYEQVTETIVDNAVQSVEVKIYDGAASDPAVDIVIPSA